MSPDSSGSSPDRETIEEKSHEQPVVAAAATTSTTTSHRKKNSYKVLHFTPQEDEYLKDGIQRHGYGKWAVILRDPTYRFQKGRSANSLLYRAARKKFPE